MKDKEILQDSEMNDPVQVPDMSIDGVVNSAAQVVTPGQEKIRQGKWAKANPAPRPVPMQTCKKIAKPPKPLQRTAQKKPVNKLKVTTQKPDNTARRLSKKSAGQSNNIAEIISKAAVTEIDKLSAIPLPETDIANSQPKDYTDYDFYYKRQGFRIMAHFFKTDFNPFLDMWNSKKNTKTIEALV